LGALSLRNWTYDGGLRRISVFVVIGSGLVHHLLPMLFRHHLHAILHNNLVGRCPNPKSSAVVRGGVVIIYLLIAAIDLRILLSLIKNNTVLSLIFQSASS
jgi:hypothetical protein